MSSNGCPPHGFLPNHRNSEDDIFVQKFWKTYDDIIILSLFTQVGIVFRLAAAGWFSYFDGTFHPQSALFTNLPLNCLSTFLLGLLSSGQDILHSVVMKGSYKDENANQPPHPDDYTLDHARRKEFQQIDSDEEEGPMDLDENGITTTTTSMEHFPTDGSPVRLNGHNDASERAAKRLRRRRRRRKRQRELVIGFSIDQNFNSIETNDDEHRYVQLQALERRMRASPSLVLFPARKQDVDVMEHYFPDGYRKDTVGGTERGDDDEDDDEEEQQYGSSPHSRGVASSPLHHRPEPQSYRQQPRQQVRPVRSTMSLDSVVMEDGPVTPRRIYNNNDRNHNDDDEMFEMGDWQEATPTNRARPTMSTNGLSAPALSQHQKPNSHHADGDATPATSTDSNCIDYGTQNDRDLDQILYEYSSKAASHVQNEFRNFSSNITRMRQVTLAEGWDVGTTPRAMSDGLMLGLRDGFCGALSSFSSWNSSMVGLIRRGNIGGAIVGYMLGLQLPIVSYKFGQHVAMYIFVWRWKHETHKDERRGYGIRLSQEDDDEPDGIILVGDGTGPVMDDTQQYHPHGRPARDGSPLEIPNSKSQKFVLPSIRATATALFVLSFVAQILLLSLYTGKKSASATQQHQVALALLFSPFGVLARWRLRKYNRLIRGFPVGTFTCNILACALSGSVGQLIAGNPGPTERILLVSMISGFAGSLSSVGIFTIEVLKGTDPLLFRFDGIMYAACTIFWGMVIGLVSSSGVDWADRQPYQDENI